MYVCDFILGVISFCPSGYLACVAAPYVGGGHVTTMALGYARFDSYDSVGYVLTLHKSLCMGDVHVWGPIFTAA